MSILNEIEEAVDKMLLTEVSNEEVIRKFINNEYPHNKEEAPKYGVRTDTWSPIWGTANLKITRVPLDMDKDDEPDERGWSLNFNATPMLYKDEDGGIYFNSQKISTSTTKVQTIIKNMIENDPELKEKVREVDRDTIVKLVRGQEVSDDLLKKIGDEEPEPAEEESPEEEAPVDEEPTEEVPEEEEVEDEEEVEELPTEEETEESEEESVE